ncbi:AraC family transcriptional regulator [Paenibacillus sp. J31TS4]|uniref:helix-turn-helix domain-containing protein n=1 Tax=Paenibacillus sp. J31TS4 TaxID=2807195 RepID=UPI001AFEBFFC|nr:helix-turn-helix transcriptional regulator [Paenibacillus sp. J31TS4]GIP41140.1 AraC family transcriptional regulator [Paenibacillus sp. J31TS4]
MRREQDDRTEQAPVSGDPFPILHARSRSYYWKGNGALSIKTFRNGRAFYETGRGHYAVEEESYLLLNAGQDYSISIESETLVESFCLFFPRRLADEVYTGLICSAGQLLDRPDRSAAGEVEFVERTYHQEVRMAAVLNGLRQEYGSGRLEPLGLEEALHGLAQELLLAHSRVQSEMEGISALKASTREELYRRVRAGHEYLTAYFAEPVRLADAARASCLSPNHFLRSYRELFGMSPHQYLTEKRLQEARKLLLRTDKTVTAICLEVGLQSPGSFSSLFARRFGTSPSRLRSKK